MPRSLHVAAAAQNPRLIPAVVTHQNPAPGGSSSTHPDHAANGSLKRRPAVLWVANESGDAPAGAVWFDHFAQSSGWNSGRIVNGALCIAKYLRLRNIKRGVWQIAHFD